ncbi:MAG: hypothetical protein ACLP6W_11430 [Bryobacteraceae bacterium]
MEEDRVEDAIRELQTYFVGHSVIFHLSVGLSVLLFVGAVFKWIEDTAAAEIKSSAGHWLLRVDRKSSEIQAVEVQDWPTIFAALFDRAFGEKHLSWRCFRRSCAASALAVTLLLLLSFWTAERRVWTWLWGAVLAAALLNVVVPDYLSLLESRWVLSLMCRTRSAVMWSALLVVNFVLTSAIAWTAFVFTLHDLLLISGCATAGIALSPRVMWTVLKSAVNYFPMVSSMFGGPTRPFVAIFVYPAFLTSIWIWLFAAAGLTIKAASRASIALNWLVRIQDISQKPLQSIGRVAGLGVCVVYCVVALGWHGAAWLRPDWARQHTGVTEHVDIKASVPPAFARCKDSRLAPPREGLSPCDLDGNGVVDECDVRLAMDAALQVIPCGRADIDRDGKCTVVDVQRVANAARKGGQCVVGQAQVGKAR